MSILVLSAALALSPLHAARASHSEWQPEREVAVRVPALDVAPTVVVWHEDDMRFLDDAPGLPAVTDPVAYLSGTRIRVRRGFSPDAVEAVEAGRF